MNIKQLNEEMKKILENYSLFNVGDRVRVIVSDRIGTIVNQISEDVYEVELDEANGLLPTIDRYYEQDLEFYEEEPSIDEPSWFDDYYYGNRE